MWSKEKSWEWYREQPWIVGFNYLPSNAVNSTEMWQKEKLDINLVKKELLAAADIGFNTCRVFVQYLLWREEKEALFDCFDSFLEAAYSCGIRVVPILFDDCAFAMREPYLGQQDDPVPGIHNSGWTPSPGFLYADSEEEQERLQAYVTEFVSRYKDDDRILFWDLYNEPGNSQRAQKSEKLLRDAFDWARNCDPKQPLTTGVWVDDAYNKVCAELSDIVSFHDYSGLEDTRKRVDSLVVYGRPMICTEWLHRMTGNCFESHMPYYKEKGIGIVNWGLVAGRTQTYLNWDASKNPKEGMPEIWQHDILHTDLTPYREAEVEYIRQQLSNSGV